MNIIQKLLWKFSKKYRTNKWTKLGNEYKQIENNLKEYLNRKA